MKALANIVVPEQVLPHIVAEIEQNHDSEQKYYLAHRKRLQNEYDELDEEIKSLFEDRKQFKSRIDIFESMVDKKGDRQKMILKELDDHSKGNQAFVVGASYILEVASKAVELFTAESTSVEQRRYLLDFVFSNLKLDGKILELQFRQPFDAIVKVQKSNEWCKYRYFP